MLLPIILTFGALLTVASAWYQWSRENEKKIANDQLNKDNKELLIKIAELSEESNNHSKKSQNELQDVNAKLFEAQETINNFRLETINNLTGGNNIPIMCVTIMEDIRNDKFITADFKILNKGKFPLKNIEFNMDDTVGAIIKTVHKKGNDKDFEEYIFDMKLKKELEEIKINAGDIMPIKIKNLYTTKFISEVKSITYNFTLQWQNGFYNGTITGYIDESKKFHATASKAWNNEGKVENVIQITDVKY